MSKVHVRNFTEEELSRIVEMAWEDRTPFEAIETQFGLNESATIQLMRKQMKRSSFKMWRERVTGRTSKHAKIRTFTEGRAYAPAQYKVGRA
jgi:uncharacterized protein (TIGR03643 family)